MRLVDHDEEVLGEVIEEGVRCRARRAVREVTRVILDAGAVAHLLHHFEVIVRALLQPLRLKEFALALQYGETLRKLRANVRHGDLHILIVRDVVGRREYHGVKPLAVDLARRHVELDDALHLVAEHLDAHAAVVVPRREYLDHVAAHAEASALKRDIVALVTDGDELLQNLLARDRLPLVHGENHLMIALRRAEAVDARDARHDDDVAPLKERTGRGVAQLIDLIVDRRILFNVGIRLGDVRLGLIEVVVADKVADVVVGEKRLELARELCGEGLVVRDDEGRTLNALDDLCHRVGLARARGSEQHLCRHTVLDAAGKIGNRLRLIAHRFKWCDDLERDLPLELRCIKFWHHRHAFPSFTKSYFFIISYPSRDAIKAQRFPYRISDFHEKSTHTGA